LGWKGHDETQWTRLCEEAQDLQIRDPKKLPPIVGYDRDFKMVRLALDQVERAGMRGIVHIEKREFSDFEPFKMPEAITSPQGLIVMNPPYGERMGETEALIPLYSQMGDLFKKRFAGWEAYVLTSNPELMKEIGLKPARKFVVFNGALECRLLKYALFQGSGRKEERE
jgi:23S rRNA (guanine2445-N2)-methyltransferase / 23S rRNA (guanine2069-N7)-methyltransferase